MNGLAHESARHIHCFLVVEHVHALLGCFFFVVCARDDGVLESGNNPFCSRSRGFVDREKCASRGCSLEGTIDIDTYQTKWSVDSLVHLYSS